MRESRPHSAPPTWWDAENGGSRLHARVRRTTSPRSNSKTTEDGNSKPFIIGSKMIAQKFLPIRVNKNIEREKENAV